MRHDPIRTGKRKSVNLSMDTGILDEARRVGINLSKVSEAAVRSAAQAEADRLWKIEHADWIRANNEWVEEHGLPLADFRTL